MAVILPLTSGFSLASSNAAIRNYQNRQAQIALDEQRTKAHDLQVQQQKHLEETPERERQAKITLNQSLLGAVDAAREQAANQFVLGPERLKALQATKGYQNATRDLNAEDLALLGTIQEQNPNMTQEEYARKLAQGEYVQGKIAEARANPAKFTDPKLMEQFLRQQYAKTSASPKNIDEMVQRQIDNDYDVMGKDIGKALLSANTTPTLSGTSKLFSGSGTSGAKPKSSLSDNNITNVEEFKQALHSKWGVESGDGRWYRDWFDIDPGKPDLTERNIAKYTGFMQIQYNMTEAAALNALEAIRDEDTTDVSLESLIRANPNATGENMTAADRALQKVLRVGSTVQGHTRGDGALLGPAAQAQLVSTYADQVKKHGANQQNILAGMKARQYTNQQRKEWLLGDYAAKPAPPPPPPPDKTNKGKEDAGSVIDNVVAGAAADSNVAKTNTAPTVADKPLLTGDKRVEELGDIRVSPSISAGDQLIDALGISGEDLRTADERNKRFEKQGRLYREQREREHAQGIGVFDSILGTAPGILSQLGAKFPTPNVPINPNVSFAPGVRMKVPQAVQDEINKSQNAPLLKSTVPVTAQIINIRQQLANPDLPALKRAQLLQALKQLLGN